MWPFIQLFLIQVHLAPNFWRRLGSWTYLIIFLEWLPLAYAIDLWQNTLIQYQIHTTIQTLILGVVLLIIGVLLHAWTAKLLGLQVTIGYTELNSLTEPQNLITSGPFSVVRHPSYIAHTLIFVGIFSITGVIAVGIVALIDLLISYIITTELEEREMSQRCGDRYKEYQMLVPKFFPKIRAKN